MARWICYLVGIVFATGCSSSTPPEVTVATIAEPAGPSRVELSDAVFRLEPPDMVRFEVKYRFFEGRPTRNYLCELSFPGTENLGKKPMEAWELKDSGTIKGAIIMQSMDLPIKAFAIKLKEAESPQSGYNSISNLLKGEVLVDPSTQVGSDLTPSTKTP